MMFCEFYEIFRNSYSVKNLNMVVSAPKFNFFVLVDKHIHFKMHENIPKVELHQHCLYFSLVSLQVRK